MMYTSLYHRLIVTSRKDAAFHAFRSVLGDKIAAGILAQTAGVIVEMPLGNGVNYQFICI